MGWWTSCGGSAASEIFNGIIFSVEVYEQIDLVLGIRPFEMFVFKDVLQ